MSIQGIGPGYNPALIPGFSRSPGVDEIPTRAVPTQPAKVTAPAASMRGHESVPLDAPAGTDPSLWGVLTSEERSFFARARSMGPLTYGPGRGVSDMPGVRLGGRIDVKI